MDYGYRVMNFITLWTHGMKKNNRMFIFNIRECECKYQILFLIFAHANANSKKICEYSQLRMRMRIFGPSLV